jgi:hypothetical protein
MALQADGKILFGGDFNDVEDTFRRGIARLNADGTLDLGFDPGSGDWDFDEDNGDDVFSLALQADGRFLAAGDFAGSGGALQRYGIARFSANGVPETRDAFDSFSGTNFDIDNVFAVTLQANGGILLGGDLWTRVLGQRRDGIALFANEPAVERLTVLNGNRILWTRGGPAPEISQVTFDLSTDGGETWSRLGPGTRIPGGWELSGTGLPANPRIRARGRTSGGFYNASSGIVESIYPTAMTALETWRQTHFQTPDNIGQAADLADPDQDGLTNLFEFATAGNPVVSGRAPVSATLTDRVINFNYVRSRSAMSSVNYAVEWCDDLLADHWSSGGVLELISFDDGAMQQVEATIPVGAASRRFVRLRVSLK